MRGLPVGRRRGRTRSTATPPSPTSRSAPASAVCHAPCAACQLHACPWTARYRTGAQARAHCSASACPLRASPYTVHLSSLWHGVPVTSGSCAGLFMSISALTVPSPSPLLLSPLMLKRVRAWPGRNMQPPAGQSA